ncbi:hypothetical protein HYALB_00000217 [Hymenoscyphus albidus]|uniref:Uncharacterized protein n=1 Tax=Hymenoscyphus albidus TaxID=595503 RepID=A0A9N9LR74_9HELO|nr:hypothetical protein HYALB_00000217 [Hymenoscyphus albidus]
MVRHAALSIAGKVTNVTNVTNLRRLNKTTRVWTTTWDCLSNPNVDQERYQDPAIASSDVNSHQYQIPNGLRMLDLEAGRRRE